VKSGKKVYDYKCSMHNRPSTPSRKCAGTAPCVEWKQISPTAACPTSCGHAAKTHTGSVVCKEKSSGKTVANSKCSGAKPSAPTKHCAATAACPLSCRVSSKHSNNAGVIVPAQVSGHTMTGGGMNNHYRSFNSKSAFEEMYPSGNHFKCDTGFGPGQLTCYSLYCKRGNQPLQCTTSVAKRFTASGVSDAQLPAGYVMTGGGLYNHYRHFDKKAQFEESRPNGNKWRGDMGQGWGDFTTYVRGCKGVTCKTVTSKRGNNEKASCPSGYQVTGCGIYHHNRNWGSLGAFEETRPDGQGCRCDAGFGSGDMTCYARCCK
jgi:hypothetical protein